jgi:hypothetical protein
MTRSPAQQVEAERNATDSAEALEGGLTMCTRITAGACCRQALAQSDPAGWQFSTVGFKMDNTLGYLAKSGVINSLRPVSFIPEGYQKLKPKLYAYS